MGFLSLALHAATFMATKDFWAGAHDSDIEECLCRESWRMDTEYHAVRMHPPGAAMASSACLV